MPRRLITSIAALACLSLAPMGAAAAAEPAPPAPKAVAGISEQVASRTDGVLRLAVADDFDGHESRTTATVHTDAGTITVPETLVDSLQSGDSVTVARSATGKVLSVENVAAEGSPTDSTGAPSDAISGVGTHNVWTVRVSWSGASAPALPGDLVSKLTSYYSAISASSKGARVKVAAKGAYADVTIPTPPTSAENCGASTIYEDTLKKLVGTKPSASRFNHLVLVLPELPASCSWWGLGTIGAGSDGRSHIWLNGPKALTPRVLDHEFGHNLGLQHSDYKYSDAACSLDSAKESLPSSCYYAYGDPWDVMGAGWADDEDVVGFMSAPNLNRISLLSSGERYTLAKTASPTLRLTPVASGSGRRLVTVPFGKNVYTVEYRYTLPGTYDDEVALRGGNAVVVRLRNTTVSNDDLVVGALTTNGAVFHASGLKITVGNLSSTGADVKVSRSDDSTAPVLGPYGYWNQEYEYPHAGVVLTTSTLAVGYASVADADSGISSVSLEVDGKARATSSSLGLTKLSATKLSQGSHTWRFVVKDIFGNKRGSATHKFRVDTGKPTVTSAPRAWLAKGTVTTKTIPSAVHWSATDGCGIIWNSVVGSNGLSKSYYGKPTPIATRVKLGTNQFKVRVADCAQRTKDSLGPKTSAALDKQSKRSGYHGTWTATKSSKALGGTEQVTKKKKAYVSYKVSARSIGWVATTGKDRGKAAVYVDGKKVATVNLATSKTHYAQQVFTKTFSKSGKHTIKIVNLSTKKIGVDGFTRLS